MASPAEHTMIVAAGPRTMGEKLRAVKRTDAGPDWIWVLLFVLVVVAVGLIAWIRSRRKSREIDRRVLTARVRDRGFNAVEAELMHRIADLRDGKEASELVPRLRRYDEALEAFLRDEGANLGPEEREALVESLAGVRRKLGFDRLPDHRTIPSSREIPSGTAVTVRPANHPDTSVMPAHVHLVNDLDFKIRILSEKESEDSKLSEPPGLRQGDGLEIFFGHGRNRRCRLRTVVNGPAEDGGWCFPLEHAHVDNISLTGDLSADASIEARFLVAGGTSLGVKIVEISGSGVTLSTPLPEVARRGTLSLQIPGEEGRREMTCERPASAGEVPTLEERTRLDFKVIKEEDRKSLLRYISQLSPAPAAAG